MTSTGKLVIGGKNSEQNEVLMRWIIKDNKDYIVMHTKDPGSPFSIITADKKNVKPTDLEECAVFTACFSQAWKAKKKTVKVDIFTGKQVSKKKTMKRGTFGVLGKVNEKKVELVLYLTKQKGKFRAVPKTDKKILKLLPGNLDKEKTALKISEMLKLTRIKDKQEIMQAIPAGGFKILK